jgi:hypothetical protein
MTKYPRLAAAIERAQSPHTRECAHNEALKAYADELLPDILGGQWMLTERYTWPPFYRVKKYEGVDDPIYDHETVFRQRGCRGTNNWRTCAVISQPYNALEPNSELRSAATALTAQYNVGIWLRADLSSWLPGRTSLVLIARRLRSDWAQNFGFHSIA